METKRTTPEFITELLPNEIFVFGSIHLGTFWRYLYEPFKSNDNKIKVLLKSILKLSFLAGNNISITEEQVRCILNIINEETL